MPFVVTIPPHLQHLVTDQAGIIAQAKSAGYTRYLRGDMLTKDIADFGTPGHRYYLDVPNNCIILVIMDGVNAGEWPLLKE